MTEARTPADELSTAVWLLAQFKAQIAEYEAMNRKQRRTERGRDLHARIGQLRQGLATWEARRAELERIVSAAAPPEAQSEHPPR